MKKAQRWYRISDAVWTLLELLLSGRRGQRDGVAKDNRQFIDEPSFEWLLRNISQSKAHSQVAATRVDHQKKGRVKSGSAVKCHCPWMRTILLAISVVVFSKIPLTVDAHDMPVKVVVTSGATANCTQH